MPPCQSNDELAMHVGERLGGYDETSVSLLPQFGYCNFNFVLVADISRLAAAVLKASK
jgi:hypothetical protein